LVVTILGVDHELQRADLTGDFERLLEQTLAKGSLDLIAEEARESDSTVAQRIALGRSIRWLNVDVTLEDKIRLGIYDELMNRPKKLLFEGGMCLGEKGWYLPHADAIREELWASRILAEKVHAALVVCGLLHMQHLAEKLATRGCEVFQNNVCASDWYKEHYGHVRLLRDTDGILYYESRYKAPAPVYGR
jgi:hypothetical protein